MEVQSSSSRKYGKEMQKYHGRIVQLQLRRSTTGILQMLNTVYGKQTVFQSKVFIWHPRLKYCHHLLEEDPHCGRSAK
jgi:hypothetical protein